MISLILKKNNSEDKLKILYSKHGVIIGGVLSKHKNKNWPENHNEIIILPFILVDEKEFASFFDICQHTVLGVKNVK